MIIFAWKGFPQYAARCVGAFVKSTKEQVVVVATRPRVPIEGMEQAAGCRVVWVGSDDESIAVAGVDKSTSLIVSGWSVPSFNWLADAVRKAGGRVFCMNDANMMLTFKEILRALRFRLVQRCRFDGFLVPGKSGRRLMRFYGVPDDKIAEGMYSADASLFKDGAPILERPQRIVYVGQLCDRKNVLAVCRAFWDSGIAQSGWTLDLYGSGPLKSTLETQISKLETGITIHDFVQPERLASVYQGARAFILASKEEHWGLVVHEAALSGCYLLLSERVGAAEDLLGKTNGRRFSPFSVEDICYTFSQLTALTDEDWSAAHAESLRLAAATSLEKFVNGVTHLLTTNH